MKLGGSPINNLKLCVVPSWLTSQVNTHGMLDFNGVSNFQNLKTILTEKEFKIFLLAQSSLPKKLRDIFSDFKPILCTDEFAGYMETHANGMEKLRKDIELASVGKKGFDRHVPMAEEAAGQSFFDKFVKVTDERLDPLVSEHYQPLMVNGNTLLLIGSNEPMFKDARAFYNAVMEELARNGIGYSIFKKTQLFREYLRLAVSN